MMQEEFEKRYGKHIHYAVYEKLEEEYIKLNIDKDEFVEYVKRHNLVEQAKDNVLEETIKNLNTCRVELMKAEANREDDYSTISHLTSELEEVKGQNKQLLEMVGRFIGEKSRIKGICNDILQELTALDSFAPGCKN